MGESLESASRVAPHTGSESAAGIGRRDGRLRRHVRNVAGAAALLLAAGGALLLGLQVLQPDAAADLVVLEAVDFAVADDVPAASGEGWTAEVEGSALQLRATYPGAMHPFWAASPATREMAVTAALAWPEGAGDDALHVGGVTVLGANGAGWGVACGTDGSAYLLAVWDGRSQALDTIPDAGCDREPFTLTIHAFRSGATDTIEARLPDGERVVLKPGEARGPFTGSGFVMASSDRTLTVPGLDVRTYEVLVSEESAAREGS
jgi:hypothetical protein